MSVIASYFKACVGVGNVAYINYKYQTRIEVHVCTTTDNLPLYTFSLYIQHTVLDVKCKEMYRGNELLM